MIYIMCFGAFYLKSLENDPRILKFLVCVSALTKSKKCIEKPFLWQRFDAFMTRFAVYCTGLKRSSSAILYKLYTTQSHIKSLPLAYVSFKGNFTSPIQHWRDHYIYYTATVKNKSILSLGFSSYQEQCKHSFIPLCLAAILSDGQTKALDKSSTKRDT